MPHGSDMAAGTMIVVIIGFFHERSDEEVCISASISARNTYVVVELRRYDEKPILPFEKMC